MTKRFAPSEFPPLRSTHMAILMPPPMQSGEAFQLRFCIS
jgi:hypothetical protein